MPNLFPLELSSDGSPLEVNARAVSVLFDLISILNG